MITNDGKNYIKRYLASQVPQIGQSIALGIGTTAAALTDKRLNFEIVRVSVSSVSYNFATDKLVYKAPVPDGLTGIIREVGLYSLPAGTMSADISDDRTLTALTSEEDNWTGTLVYNSTNTRLGVDSIRQTPAASATSTNELTGLTYDLSDFSNNDALLFAYNSGNTNVSSVRVRFKTDSSNYWQWTQSSPGSGYRIDSVQKSALTATGTPNWANITSIEVATTSTSSGGSIIDWDAIRIVDNDFTNPDSVLVSRDVLGSAYAVSPGTVNEIEYTFPVTI